MFEGQKKIEQEDRDLGFGSVVAQQSQQRLLNRDGSFNVVRRGLGLRSSLSPYHSLITMSWLRFVLLALAWYLVTNALFATGYFLLGPDAIMGRFATDAMSQWIEAFFFSVHTISTVGYGNILAASMGANILMTLESIVGLFALALGTGLIFARFSRPQAKVLFSDKAVMAPYRGITALMFRITNERRSQMVDIEARLLLSRFEETENGRRRQFHSLGIERTRVSFLPLSWTVVHPIDEHSPLYDVSEEEFLASDPELLILITGMDETFSQVVHSRSSYEATEVVWQARFQSLFESDRPHGHLAIDVSRLHDIEAI